MKSLRNFPGKSYPPTLATLIGWFSIFDLDNPEEHCL
jgi:hypothetical protein